MFLKDFDYGLVMHKMRRKYKNNLMHYGLIGEERVVYELSKINPICICLYNVRLFVDDSKAQFDFIVILPSFILIIEVKNLLGNLIITEDQSFEREVSINGVTQKSGMSNPFIQMEYQEKVLKEYLLPVNKNKKILSLLVMANDKMIIRNLSSKKNIVKYDEIVKYIKEKETGNILSKEDYEIGEYILKGDKEYNYYIVPIIKRNIMNQYTPEFENYSDLEMFLELIKFRKQYSEKHKMPICNVFTNIEAEELAIKKPQNKEEFVNIKGFKNKRYEMFGEDIIKIFKNH